MLSHIMIRNPRALFLAYLGTLSIIGGGVIWLATSRMGPGISTDSAMILATAENLAKGRGLIDYAGTELTQFPPLYSMILALGSLLFRQDVFVVGWALNVLVFAALIWVTGQLLFDTFDDEPIFAYVGAFVVFSSTSLIEISANIASDPLFMLMVLFFLMCAAAYLKSGGTRYALVAAALVIIACFQRYAGLSLVIAGSLMAAYRNRKVRRWAAASAILFGLITAAPILGWGYLHNAPINGTVFGARLPSIPTLNFTTGAEKVLYWFIPYRFIASAGALYLLAGIMAVCALLVIVTDARQFLRRIDQPTVIAHGIFLLVYFSVLVFDISYYELKGLKTDRIHIIALPSLLLVLSAMGSHFLQAGKRKAGSTLVYGVAILACLAWSAFPITRSAEYVRNSMINGDISSYNSINKGDVQKSELAKYLRGLRMDDERVYSNGGDTTWLILRREVSAVPVLNSVDRAGELQTRYAGWPGAGNQGYVVWLNAEAHKTNYATPQELSSIADMQLLYGDGSATVYYVKPR
jgi:hypothetical protein